MWNPIESAPKDTPIWAHCVGCDWGGLEVKWQGVIVWETRPMWPNEDHPGWAYLPRDGFVPTHWMPLPAPPDIGSATP